MGSGDAYDIIISSAIPYMDAVVIENQMADGLQKTQRVDDFIEDLEIYTLKDFRPWAPTFFPFLFDGDK